MLPSQKPRNSKGLSSHGFVACIVYSKGRDILSPIFAIIKCRQSEMNELVSSSRFFHVECLLKISAAVAGRNHQVTIFISQSHVICPQFSSMMLLAHSQKAVVHYWFEKRLGQSNSTSSVGIKGELSKRKCVTLLIHLWNFRYALIRLVMMSVMKFLRPWARLIRCINTVQRSDLLNFFFKASNARWMWFKHPIRTIRIML